MFRRTAGATGIQLTRTHQPDLDELPAIISQLSPASLGLEGTTT